MKNISRGGHQMDAVLISLHLSIPTGDLSLRRETLPAGAVGDGIGVGHFESALLQVIAVVEFRSAHEEGAFWVNHNPDSL